MEEAEAATSLRIFDADAADLSVLVELYQLSASITDNVLHISRGSIIFHVSG